MKNYQQPIVAVIFYERNDIIASSQYDNIGGIPEEWENGTN
jgi:hypothetical protein